MKDLQNLCKSKNTLFGFTGCYSGVFKMLSGYRHHHSWEKGESRVQPNAFWLFRLWRPLVQSIYCLFISYISSTIMWFCFIFYSEGFFFL